MFIFAIVISRESSPISDKMNGSLTDWFWLYRSWSGDYLSIC